MKPIDVAQWVFLAAIAAGFWLISPALGLIAGGILGIVGTTAKELSTAVAKSREQRAQQRQRQGG